MEVILSRMFWQVWNMSMTAGWCIAAIWILHLVFRKLPEKYLYALWLVAAFRLLCPVSVSTDVSVFNLGGVVEEILAGERQGETIASVQNDLSEELLAPAGMYETTGLPDREAPNAAAAYAPKILLRSMLHREDRTWFLMTVGPYVWAAGILIFGVYFVISTWRLQKKIGKAVLASESSARTVCPVYECDSLISPFAAGIFRPRIYLPCHLTGKQREMVLLHEQNHIRRGDHLVKLLAFCLLAVYWFHPLVWTAWFGMCRDMEMSCDEKVLELLGEEHKKEYGMTLLSCAVNGHPASRMPLAFGEQNVESRIRHILSYKRPAAWIGAISVCALVVVMVLLGTNGKGAEESSRGENGHGQEMAEASENLTAEDTASLLYEARNPYVGDAPADRKLSETIGTALPDSAFARYTYTMELQTTVEPYGYGYVLSDVIKEQPTFWEMAAPAALMLALTDNLGQAKWSYRAVLDGQETDISREWSLEEAAKWCQVENLKDYGASPERVRELLDILENLRQTDTGSDLEWVAPVSSEPMEERENDE